MLYRLYHRGRGHLYEPQDVQFRCTCSRQRCADAADLPTDEVADMLEQDGNIDMHCDYCAATMSLTRLMLPLCME